MQAKTHEQLSARLCGRPLSIEEGRAVVELTANPDMRADAQGLVHGGFIFGLADYAAMLCVNHPNVVLGRAEVRFIEPVVVSDNLRAVATRVQREDKKHVIEVEVVRGETRVFSGRFTCFVPDQHVLVSRGEA